MSADKATRNATAKARRFASRELIDGRLVATEATRHGVYTTYNNWGCQCVPCVAAHSDKLRTYRADPDAVRAERERRRKRTERERNDPERVEQRRRRARDRYANNNPEARKQKQRNDQERARERYANDPEYAERKRAAAREYYARVKARS